MTVVLGTDILEPGKIYIVVPYNVCSKAQVQIYLLLFDTYKQTVESCSTYMLWYDHRLG